MSVAAVAALYCCTSGYRPGRVLESFLTRTNLRSYTLTWLAVLQLRVSVSQMCPPIGGTATRAANAEVA